VSLPTGQQTTAARPSGPADGTQSSQLQTDLDQLRTDQQTVAAKSAVTSDELDQLKTDSQSITSAGLNLDPKSLQTAVNNLVTAVAGGADTTQAQADFNALFSGSKVSQAVIDKTFNDLVQTIQDSKITADDATLIAADQTAVQADLDALPQGGPGAGFTGPGGGFSGPIGQGGGFTGSGRSFRGPIGHGGGFTGPVGQSGFAANSQGGLGSVFAARGSGMAGQTASSHPATVTNSNPGAPTGMGLGNATIAPPSTRSPIASTANNAVPTTPNHSAGGRIQGGMRGHMVRNSGGRFGRNATGASEGGVQDLASGMGRQFRTMNRFRGR
jgi:hypothetical protein